jgi:translocation and assembly module TamA
VIAGRTRLGSIVGIPRDDLAPSRRLYAGGGGSVRGYGFQQIGPRETIPNPDFDPEDPEAEPEFLSAPLGGRSLAEFAIEARYRFGNYGVVAFVDAGQVYESQYPTFDNLRFGVGIGGRLYTNFGPVRIDIATPIDRRPDESWLAVYVSIGQAF